ncbi:MAG: hypothetical protein AB1505_08995 [Candidatus Latescibacterota bacterium]
MQRARCDLIDDEEPYHGEVPELAGIGATGRAPTECRANLVERVHGCLQPEERGIPQNLTEPGGQNARDAR